jgi:hypothetical protein
VGRARRFQASPAIQMKATAEIGRMGIEFKVNAGLFSNRALKAPPRGGRGGQ